MAPVCTNCSGSDFVWANDLKTGTMGAGLSLRSRGEVPLGARICRTCGHAELFLRDLTILHQPHTWRPGEFVPIVTKPAAKPPEHHHVAESPPAPPASAPVVAAPPPPPPPAPTAPAAAPASSSAPPARVEPSPTPAETPPSPEAATEDAPAAESTAPAKPKTTRRRASRSKS